MRDHLAINPATDGSLVLSCRSLGTMLDQSVSRIFDYSGPKSPALAAALESLLLARSEAEIWMTAAGMERAGREPIWFLLWEHETFDLINKVRTLSDTSMPSLAVNLHLDHGIPQSMLIPPDSSSSEIEIKI